MLLSLRCTAASEDTRRRRDDFMSCLWVVALDWPAFAACPGVVLCQGGFAMLAKVSVYPPPPRQGVVASNCFVRGFGLR